jgi:hypothetical protein
MEQLPHQDQLFLSKTYFLIHCGDKQENTFRHSSKGDVLANISWICVFALSFKGTPIQLLLKCQIYQTCFRQWRVSSIVRVTTKN